MEEWIKRRRDGLIDNVIFALLVAIGITVWSAIKSLSPPIIFVLALATFALILFIFWLIRHFTRRDKQSDWVACIVDGAVIGQGFEFYPSRTILSKRRSLLEQIKSSSVIWALWNTGTQAFVDDALKERHVKKLILPHPERASLDYLAEAVGKDKPDLVSDIYAITKQAIKEGVEIRWHKGLTGNTMMIGDPYGPNSWIHLETISSSAAPNRPSFRIERQPFSELFETLLAEYQSMWDSTEPPTQHL